MLSLTILETLALINGFAVMVGLVLTYPSDARKRVEMNSRIIMKKYLRDQNIGLKTTQRPFGAVYTGLANSISILKIAAL